MLQAQTLSKLLCASSNQTNNVLLKAQKARKTPTEKQVKAAPVCPGINLTTLGEVEPT